MRKLNMPRRLSSSAARTHGGNMLFMLPTIIQFCIVVLIPFFQGIPYSCLLYTSPSPRDS